MHGGSVSEKLIRRNKPRCEGAIVAALELKCAEAGFQDGIRCIDDGSSDDLPVLQPGFGNVRNDKLLALVDIFSGGNVA